MDIFIHRSGHIELRPPRVYEGRTVTEIVFVSYKDNPVYRYWEAVTTEKNIHGVQVFRQV